VKRNWMKIMKKDKCEDVKLGLYDKGSDRKILKPKG
jgi:hypothetical protein